ncbi:MAG: lipocalin-like domain-containing protein [Woeseiaceae bacterium]|nr:lipocalin-like domain-containing protein [Woeseiaceae bacterium]
MLRRHGLFLLLLFLHPGLVAADDAAASSRSELAGLLGAGESGEFARAVDPRTFSFPADHGPHEAFRNEWWYFTGNLDSEDGRRFGFELTIFRFSLSPDPVAADTEWRTNQVYIAHFAVTDADGDAFYAAEKSARGALGLAGAQADPFRVWIDDWEILGVDDDTWRIVAGHEDFAVDLELTALKPPVLNGDAGLSQKSDEPGNASYYYTMPRWRTDGAIRIGKDVHAVSGASWLDREWSTSALADDQQGWDWFALQFADNTELMFYGLRKTDGTQDPLSSGTWINADGSSEKLTREQVTAEVTKLWESPRGGVYPAGWRISIEDKSLFVEVTPVIADQELSTIVRYWEGAVDVSGTRDGEPIEGRGYVELTGYAEDSSADD